MPDEPAADAADGDRAMEELQALRELVRAKRYALQKAREDGDLAAAEALGHECQRLVGVYTDLVARLMRHFPSSPPS